MRGTNTTARLGLLLLGTAATALGCPGNGGPGTWDQQTPLWCQRGEPDTGFWALSASESLWPANDQVASVAVEIRGLSGFTQGPCRLKFYRQSSAPCCGERLEEHVADTVDLAFADEGVGDYRVGLGGCQGGDAGTGDGGCGRVASASYRGVQGDGLLRIRERRGDLAAPTVAGQVDLVFETSRGHERLLASFETPDCQ
jgi:hypothetical protein